MNYKKRILIQETLMTYYALSLLRHGVQLVLFYFLPLLVYLPHLFLHHYHSEVNHKNTSPLENGMVPFQVIHSSGSGQTCFHLFFCYSLSA